MIVLGQLLMRAPLLPVRSLADRDALRGAPLGELALRLASPTLDAHAGTERAARARRNYAARAAFRPTPQGLLAGVAIVGSAPGPSRVSLGAPRAHLAVSYARLAALGRALLAAPAGVKSARIRHAPSLLRDAEQAQWIAFGEGASARADAVLVDELVGFVLDHTRAWTRMRSLLGKIAQRIGDPDAALELVLQLVDDGLLHHDLEPPLVGRLPALWARDRLVPLCAELAAPLALLDDDALPAALRVTRAEELLAILPGAASGSPIVATLCHDPGKTRIARAPLERAASLAPILFALADALAAPLRERALVPGLDELVECAGSLVGEGLLPLPALALGHYGACLDPAAEPTRVPPSSSVLAQLAAQVVAAARAQEEEIVLDVATLGLPAQAPASFELQLAPCTPPPDAEEGTDWLLGVHGPAGSSWGRYAAALGAPMEDALRELARAEASVDGGALRVDVSYAPSRELADLCQVPAVREAALAISSWPEEGALLPALCELARDPASEADGGFVVGGRALVVSPLHRVRSTTAPPSLQRALLADTLLRQHAPWGLAWGALATLPWLPRVRLSGFVIAPQSWQLPERLDDTALRAWRVSARVPRHVQVGAEDALLPIDLDSAQDRASLLALPGAERQRVHEVWPPIGRELDSGGRRVELICAVVNDEDQDFEEARRARLGALALALPPSEGAAAAGWRTVRIYAARERHAELLALTLAPFLDEQRGLDAWFFLPYVEPPGARPHLRVRLHARQEAVVTRLATQLVRVFDGAITRGAVATVEIGAYHPERARYGAAMGAVERVFESDSRAVLDALLAGDDELPMAAQLVAAFDAIAVGLGLGLEQRLTRCTDALSGYDVAEAEEREHLAPAYRALQRPLRALLAEPRPAWLDAHVRRVRATKLRKADAEALLPTLVHLAAVRRCGADRDEEVRALYLWRRTLESLRAAPLRPRRGPVRGVAPSPPSGRSSRSVPRRRAPPRS